MSPVRAAVDNDVEATQTDAARAAEERRLFLRLQRFGDRTARDQLVERFMPLAAQLARRYRNTSQSFEDLLQVANLGLVQAVDRFDADRGLRFSSFAVPTILGELRRHFRDTGWAVRVPRAVQENVAKVRATQTKLSARLGRAPTPAEIADATGLDHEAVLESLEAADAFQASSLDAPGRGTHDDDAAALLSAVPVHDQRFELVEYASVVRGTMAALPERDREAIRLRFGQDLTQDEIAQRLGISQMQVSRLLRRALERLRTVAEASTLD
ncbi:MAG: SigB/SigF/SigG family RNA polymerase sigma factor [Solirubrobacteraceae bacterium]